jgi:flagellar assembly protein FliH
MKAVKFTFDTDFDAGRAMASRETRRQSFSTDEIDAIRASATAEGRRDGDVLAQQAVAASIGDLAAAIHRAVEAMDEELEIIRADAARLAFAAAKKLAGAALKTAPDEEILDTLRLALHQAVGEPRVTLKTTPHLSERLRERAAEIAADEGFEGRLQYVGDPNLSGADCRVEWHGGGLERNLSVLETQLSDIIARRFSATPRAREE